MICKFHATAWPWLHASIIYLLSVSNLSACKPIFSCVRSFSTLRVQVVLRHNFGHFNPVAVSLLPPEKLSNNQPLGKLWQRDRINITGLNEWCRHKKTLACSRTFWCKLRFFLNSVPFSTILQSCNAFQRFPTAKNIPDFFNIFIVKFSFYIIDNLK